MMSMPNILTLDIETSPNLAHVWSLWNTNVQPKQVIEQWDIMCFAAHWVGTDSSTLIKVSDYFDGYTPMLNTLWDLLDEADMVLTYNGKRFDMKRIRTVMALEG